MCKLWKRLIMLGALIGCMATAAWAGNVEVDITNTKSSRGGPEVQYAADEYYMTSSSRYRTDATYHYHFDKDGRVSWQETSESGGSPTVTRYTYDQNGNLIKSAVSGEDRNSGHYTNVDTYTYDNQGRVLTHVWDSKRELSTSYKQTDTFTYRETSIVVDIELKSSEGHHFLYRLEYALNEKNQIVGCKHYSDIGEDDLFLGYEGTFVYDENGNLIKSTSVNVEENVVFSVEEFFYDENGRCVKSGDSDNSTFYEYDENGNVVSVSYTNYDDDGNKTLTLDGTYTYEKLSPVQDAAIYTDVANKTEYYYDAVNWAAVTGVTAGVGDNQFAPNQGCTRAQLVSFLWRAAGEPEPETTKSPFTDVQNPNEYYYKAVLWAAENGIAAGVGNNQFAPNQTCTRAQIVSFIYRASGDKETYTENPFQDVSSKDYYYQAALWGAANGVVAGTSDTTFSPVETCTRAQGVSFLYRGIGLY